MGTRCTRPTCVQGAYSCCGGRQIMLHGAWPWPLWRASTCCGTVTYRLLAVQFMLLWLVLLSCCEVGWRHAGSFPKIVTGGSCASAEGLHLFDGLVGFGPVQNAFSHHKGGKLVLGVKGCLVHVRVADGTPVPW